LFYQPVAQSTDGEFCRHSREDGNQELNDVSKNGIPDDCRGNGKTAFLKKTLMSDLMVS
jgi:hypothetical protein